MKIANKTEAKQYLGIVNYYRFKAYWYPFYNPISKTFRYDISFTKIKRYYDFDADLRKLIFHGTYYIYKLLCALNFPIISVKNMELFPY